MSSPKILQLHVINKRGLLRFCRACGCEVEKPCEVRNNRAKPDLPLLLKRYIPEFDIEVDNPCLCKECLITLYNFHYFKRRCLRTEQNVRLHMREHPKVETVNFNEIFTPKEEENNVITNNTSKNSKTSFTCEYCNRVLSTKVSLLSHKQKFHKNQRYQCSKCNRKFRSKTVLDNHLAYHKKPSAGRYKCKECNLVYHSPSGINAHKRQQHLNVVKPSLKSYQCEKCERKFTHKSSIVLHMQTHDGDNTKTHKCIVCNYVTNNQFNLDRHLATKHIPNCRKLITCKICDSSFTYKQSLKKHMEAVHGRPLIE